MKASNVNSLLLFDFIRQTRLCPFTWRLPDKHPCSNFYFKTSSFKGFVLHPMGATDKKYYYKYSLPTLASDFTKIRSTNSVNLTHSVESYFLSVAIKSLHDNNIPCLVLHDCIFVRFLHVEVAHFILISTIKELFIKNDLLLQILENSSFTKSDISSLLAKLDYHNKPLPSPQDGVFKREY